MDQAQFQTAVLAQLKIIVDQTKKVDPGTGAVTFGGLDKPHIDPPPEKSYAAAVSQYHGVEKLALMIRQRTAGYPESSAGIIGTWDGFPWVIDFKKDYPGLFKK
ncbi:MAG: hypothetical protein NTY86_16760 [Deltaproteobacteria bacterium]|nr:hypothetical protein [Deltaproteobacteria bacterium]